MSWLDYYLYYTGALLVLFTVILVIRQFVKNRALLEDKTSTLLIERRKRSIGLRGADGFEKYTSDELYALEGHLRDIAYRKLAGQKLSEADKQMMRSFLLPSSSFIKKYGLNAASDCSNPCTLAALDRSVCKQSNCTFELVIYGVQ